MKKVKRYKKLKGIMFANDVTWEELAGRIGRSRTYASTRATGKMPFDMDDVYNICDFLNIPYEEIHIYFPPGGVA